MKNKLTILIFVLLGICRIQAQVTAVLTPPTGCESNGMIELTDINGEGPFTIDWSVTTSEPSPSGPPQFVDTPLTEWNNQTKITGLAPGAYCVTVKDAKCCEARYCFDLEKKEGSVKIKYKKNPTSCYAGESIKLTSIVKNGSIEIEVTNPDDWEYLWVLDEYPFGKWDTKDISGLQFGNYTLTATNKTTGCVETLKVFLCCCAFTIIYSDDEPKVIYENNQPAQCSGADIGSNIVSVGHTATPPTSNTANNGSIKLNVKTFGTASGIIYYSWNETTTGKTFATKDISNLPPGEYCYTVTDGCTTFKDCVPIYVCEENPIKLSATLVKPCENSNFSSLGEIMLNTTGGNTPYKYNWNNGGNTVTIQTLKKGIYTVTVTDKGGCTAFGSYTLELGKVTSSATNNPCQTIYNCDGRKVYTQNGTIFSVFNDPFDCTLENFYCTATGDKIKTIQHPYQEYDANNSCELYGKCPNGKWVLLEVGYEDIEYTIKKDLSCNCYTCIKQPICRFPKYNVISLNGPWSVGKLNIELTFDNSCKDGCLWTFSCDGQFVESECGKCQGGGLKPLKQFVVDGVNAKEELIGNIFHALKEMEKNKGFDLLIPANTNLEMSVEEFFSTKDIGKHRIVEKEEGFNEYICNKKQECTLRAINEDISLVSIWKDKNSMTISPNPFDNYISMSIPSETTADIQIELFNALGAKVISENKKIFKGDNQINLKTASIPKGIYFIKISNKILNQVLSYKLIKE